MLNQLFLLRVARFRSCYRCGCAPASRSAKRLVGGIQDGAVVLALMIFRSLEMPGQRVQVQVQVQVQVRAQVQVQVQVQAQMQVQVQVSERLLVELRRRRRCHRRSSKEGAARPARRIKPE